MSNSCFNRDFLISLLSYDIMCPGPLCLMVSGVGSPWAWSRPCGPVPSTLMVQYAQGLYV